jgi:predicted RNA-binding Zn-ribbon protein involved in translation (DUF1610 family)
MPDLPSLPVTGPNPSPPLFSLGVSMGLIAELVLRWVCNGCGISIGRRERVRPGDLVYRPPLPEGWHRGPEGVLCPRCGVDATLARLFGEGDRDG